MQQIYYTITMNMNASINAINILQFNCPQHKVEIFSVYLPGGATYQQISLSYANDLRRLCRTRKNRLICGDFNSRHRLWNCAASNQAGRILYNEYSSNNFLVFRPNRPTYYPLIPGRNASTIDITLASGGVNMNESITHPSPSDHCYVTFTIDLNNPM